MSEELDFSSLFVELQSRAINWFVHDAPHAHPPDTLETILAEASLMG
jgi:hypothetical protein